MRDSANLDFLRGCAVLSVVLSHVYGAFFGGNLSTINSIRIAAENVGLGGVLFFFVHTSLVLFLSMERTRSRQLALDFYVRRFFRIYPLCWLCIAVVLTTGLGDTPDSPAHQFQALGLRGVIANVALLQNITRSPDAIGPLWSLPWEVQMYVVLPVLFILVARKGKGWLPIALWAALTVCGAMSALPGFPKGLGFTRIPPMFLGGIVAYQMRNRRRIFKGRLWPVFVLSLIGVRLLLLHGDSFWTPWNAAVNSFTCLVLGLSIPMFSEIQSPALVECSKQLAKYSYGIYLFHVPARALVLGYMSWIPSWGRCAAFVVITGAVSVLVYHILEEPLIKLGRRITTKLFSPHVRDNVLREDQPVFQKG